MRTREGMKVAKAEGRLRGKQPKLNPALEPHLVELWHTGRHTSVGHMPPYGGPLLWIADAVAWCPSAGGAWRDRVAPIIAAIQDVTCLNAAKPGRPPSGVAPGSLPEAHRPRRFPAYASSMPLSLAQTGHVKIVLRANQCPLFLNPGGAGLPIDHP